MRAAGDDGVAVVAHHVGVDAVKLRDFQIERLGVGLYRKADTRKLYLALLQHVIYAAKACVEALAKRIFEIGHQRCAAARGVIGDRGGRTIGRNLRQERRARRVIGNKLRFHLNPLPRKEVGQLADVVKKARQLDHDAPAASCQHKHLVVDQIVRLIGVKCDAVFLVHVHMALVEFHRTHCNFVHFKYLQNNFCADCRKTLCQ